MIPEHRIKCSLGAPLGLTEKQTPKMKTKNYETKFEHEQVTTKRSKLQLLWEIWPTNFSRRMLD